MSYKLTANIINIYVFKIHSVNIPFINVTLLRKIDLFIQ